MPVATSSSDSSKWFGLAVNRAFLCVCVCVRPRVHALCFCRREKTDIEREGEEGGDTERFRDYPSSKDTDLISPALM